MMQLFLSLFSFFILAVMPVRAQGAVTYPIAELGNCADKAACRSYCSDPLHHDACTAYGTSRGILKSRPASQETTAAAAKELGCSSAESCKQFCTDPSHYAACDAFAKKNGLAGGFRVAKEKLSGEITQQVSSLLGNACTDYTSCKSYCDQPLNRVRCTEVAKQLDLKGGIENRGPGGCASEATCKVYCSDPSHFNECRPFVPQTIAGTPVPFRGPGGCETEDACRLYCLQHPESCPGVRGTPSSPTVTVRRSSSVDLRSGCALPESERPEELRDEVTYRRICVGTPENFSDYAIYCKQFPTKCGSEGYKNFCRDFPAKCGLMENREIPQPSYTPRPSVTVIPGIEVTEDRSGQSVSPTRTPTLRPLKIEQTGILSTPTRIPSPTAWPTRTPTPTKPVQEISETRVPSPTKSPSPTKLPTYTIPPTSESTRIPLQPSPTETRAISGSGSNSGSSTQVSPTPAPSVRGVSTISPFGYLLRFLFGR